MKTILLCLCLGLSAVSIPLQTGCQHTVALAPGGAYQDATLAIADRSILDASKALTAFLDWQRANAAFLARWPEVGQFSARVAAQKDGWIRSAYEARDALAKAQDAFRSGSAQAGLTAAQSQLNGSLAVLQSAVDQFTVYKNAHPNG